MHRAHLIAITRGVSPALVRCELTHRRREPIDVARASSQHDRYEQVLTDVGCQVVRLPADPSLPDSVFVEDTAVVFDELAVIARPGATSRRPETAAVAGALERYRPLRWIEEPATLDGGDVLVAGRRVFVGRSGRTNTAAVQQLQQILSPFGYDVLQIEVRSCLHLKSAATSIDDHSLLVNRERLPSLAFQDFDLIDVDPAEPEAANVLAINRRIICPKAHPRTRKQLERRGLAVVAVDVSELAKAEGGLTCCSVILDADQHPDDDAIEPAVA